MFGKSPKDRAIEKHRAESAAEHEARAQELMADAEAEPDWEKARILMQAAEVRMKYAKNPNWRSQ